MIEFIPTNCYECGEPLKVIKNENFLLLLEVN